MAGKAGKVIDYENTTPISYAKALAYLSDPSAIRAGVARQFGAARAPSIEQCRKLIQERNKPPHRAKCRERYGRNFRCDHPQTEANTIITIDGIDTCKTCAELKQEKDRLQSLLQSLLEIEQASDKLKAHFEAQERIDAARARYEEALRAADAAKVARVRMIGSDVIKTVAQLFMIEPSEIVSDNRFERYVDARATVAQILRNRGLSYNQVGRIMRRDHTTIMNLIQKLDRYKARNPMVEHVLGIVT